MNRNGYVLQNILMSMIIIILSVLTYSFVTEKHQGERFTLDNGIELYEYVNGGTKPTFVNRYYEDNTNYK